MGPFRVATSLKAKVEKFKIRLPIITALCTSGMKDRHWDMISKKVKYFESTCTIVHYIYVKLREWLVGMRIHAGPLLL